MSDFPLKPLHIIKPHQRSKRRLDSLMQSRLSNEYYCYWMLQQVGGGEKKGAAPKLMIGNFVITHIRLLEK